MKIPLLGGPHDGQMVEVDVGKLGYIDEHGQAWDTGNLWIDDDFELCLPYDDFHTPESIAGGAPEALAVYRWLFGPADHLDYAGWRWRNKPEEAK